MLERDGVEIPGQGDARALDADKLGRLGRHEVHMDRKLERTLAMLMVLKELRPATVDS